MDILDFSKQLPSWLDKDLFDKAIQTYEFDPQAKVNSFDIKAATQAGENFSSAVFRATIKFTSKYSKNEKEMSVIIKTQPVDVDSPEIESMKDTTMFENEIGVYLNVLNNIQELISSVGYKDVMCPRLIYQTMKPKPVIIIEDVTISGFDTPIKSIHEDFELSKMIVKRLAKFHAASFYLHDEQKIDASRFDACIFKVELFANMIYGYSYDILLKLMSNWEGFEEFIEPIKKMRANLHAKVCKIFTPNEGNGAFNVLNHGDFHFKNILYKMDKKFGKVEDFVMYDFQICTYATPAIDLCYFLYNFVSDKDRITRFNEILAIYHKQFVEALQRFGYLKQPPSLLDLQIEMLKSGHLQVQCAMLLYPFMIVDMSTFTSEDFAAGLNLFNEKTFDNERFKRVVKEELKVFMHKGFLPN
ncbi:unnamed protein product [Chironomus riparius]|uniref:CHK kinase-like domain-containing protein n=1 Tax=Chironomus riparius TaxID=315576 RepID=A0A9N9RWD5_9DIPT|nr:unnamed protein product [Chironomus riparius]